MEGDQIEWVNNVIAFYDIESAFRTGELAHLHSYCCSTALSKVNEKMLAFYTKAKVLASSSGEFRTNHVHWNFIIINFHKTIFSSKTSRRYHETTRPDQLATGIFPNIQNSLISWIRIINIIIIINSRVANRYKLATSTTNERTKLSLLDGKIFSYKIYHFKLPNYKQPMLFNEKRNSTIFHIQYTSSIMILMMMKYHQQEDELKKRRIGQHHHEEWEYFAMWNIKIEIFSTLNR